MAKLLSEDNQVKTSIEIILLKDQMQNKPSISWIPYELILCSADKEVVYKKENGSKGAGDYVLALEPINEVKNLITGIKKFLDSKTSNMFSFEAIEPSFELLLERSFKGYSVTCWIDAGNVISNHSTWDGLGIRFFTSEENLLSFLGELNKEVKKLASA